LPTYEAAFQAAESLRDHADLQEPIVLPLAQLHRNHASSLRRSGHAADAAAAYEKAHDLYHLPLAEAHAPPVWLLQEVATLECWRASILYGLHQDQQRPSTPVRPPWKPSPTRRVVRCLQIGWAESRHFKWRWSRLSSWKRRS